MATTNPIPPFPTDIDRDAFGNWLSGFTDGEGCFEAQIYPGAYALRFVITLRADDRSVLEQIAAYWSCGQISKASSRKIGKPQLCYSVRTVRLLQSIVVPHFLRYPLRAKKQRDFMLWKEAVALKYQVSLRKRRGSGHYCGGLLPVWTDWERKHFEALIATLKKQRTFDIACLVIPHTDPDLPLFDEGGS